MPLSIVSNIASLAAQRQVNKTQAHLNKNMMRLSTGLRINSASDDSAGLAISERSRAQIRSLAQAERNGEDGISMLQVAEGGMMEVHGILSRMRELAVQSANDTNSASNRDYLQGELQELLDEISRIGLVTTFNGVELLYGNHPSDLDFQIGINSSPNDQITVAPGDIDISPSELWISTPPDISESGDPHAAIEEIDHAINWVSTTRANIGAAQNRMEVAVHNLGNMREALAAADSRIRDADVAEETAGMTRNSILMQSGVAVLAQANQHPSVALSLLSN